MGTRLKLSNLSQEVKDYILDNAALLLDSSEVTALINSAYVQARQITYSTADFPDSAGTTTLAKAAISVTDAGGAGSLSYSNGVITYTGPTNSDFLDSSTVTGVINASYIQSNQTTYSNLSEFTNDTNYLDSSTVTDVISSIYIQSNQTTYNTSDFTDSAYVTGLPVSTFTNDTNYLDSSTVTGVISASYIQANQTTYNTSDFVDSAYVTTQINNLIDGAPGTLDTLNEIAAALNDDDSAYATLVNLIGDKDSDFVKSAADQTWIQSQQITYNTSDFADSSFVTTQIAAISIPSYGNDYVDSAYVLANTSSVDSAFVSGKSIALSIALG